MFTAGGGGGSFDGSLLTTNADFIDLAGVESGNGSVTIKLVSAAPPPPSVPEPGSLALFGGGVASLLSLGLIAGRRRLG